MPNKYIERIAKNIKKYERWFRILLTVAGVLLLALASLYGVKQANYQQSNNSDNIISGYFFKNFERNDLILPGHHSNILLFPVYALQAILPYNYKTYSAINILLVILTIGFWAYILLRVIGTKYLTLVCLVFASILFASPSLLNVLIGVTARNIEYPVALAFILLLSKLIGKKPFSRLQMIGGICIGLLFILAASGDSLLFYIIVLPLILSFLFYWLQTGRRLEIDAVKAIFIIVGSVVLAMAIKKVLGSLGLVIYYNDPTLMPRIVPATSLSMSMTTALQQVLDLNGANIFGLNPLRLSSIIILLNLLILIVATIGFVATIFHKSKAFKQGQKINEGHNFVELTLAFSFFITFAVYVLSDQVVHIANGVLVSSDQARYLSIVPLLTVAGFMYAIRYYYGKHRTLLNILPVIFIVVFAFSATSIRSLQTGGNLAANNMRGSINNIVRIAEENQIRVALTGYWYGASTQFWSHGSLQYASVLACNFAEPKFNNRVSWYIKNAKVKKSALIIDRSGPDNGYWNCSDDHLLTIYGKPSQIFYTNGVDGAQNPVKDTLEIWVYDYDVRSKVSTVDLL